MYLVLEIIISRAVRHMYTVLHLPPGVKHNFNCNFLLFQNSQRRKVRQATTTIKTASWHLHNINSSVFLSQRLTDGSLKLTLLIILFRKVRQRSFFFPGEDRPLMCLHRNRCRFYALAGTFRVN